MALPTHLDMRSSIMEGHFVALIRAAILLTLPLIAALPLHFQDAKE